MGQRVGRFGREQARHCLAPARAGPVTQSRWQHETE